MNEREWQKEKCRANARRIFEFAILLDLVGVAMRESLTMNLLPEVAAL